MIVQLLQAVQRQIGGPVAGPNGTFDGRRQARVGPVARKVKIVESRARRRGACAFSSGVAAKVARRSRTICQGGRSAGKPATCATSRQIVAASSSRDCSSSRSAPLIVIESRPG